MERVPLIVYRLTTLGWATRFLGPHDYSTCYLHEGGAWLCNESYRLIPGMEEV